MPSPSPTSGQPFGWPTLRSLLAVAALGALAAACSYTPSDRQWDVGSMAFPQPLAQGDLSVTTTASRQPFDTGSMALPAPAATGEVRRAEVSRQAQDTGSMAYPAPLPIGNGPAIQVR